MRQATNTLAADVRVLTLNVSLTGTGSLRREGGRAGTTIGFTKRRNLYLYHNSTRQEIDLQGPLRYRTTEERRRDGKASLGASQAMHGHVTYLYCKH
jgi:hypothetical protein